LAAPLSIRECFINSRPVSLAIPQGLNPLFLRPFSAVRVKTLTYQSCPDTRRVYETLSSTPFVQRIRMLGSAHLDLVRAVRLSRPACASAGEREAGGILKLNIVTLTLVVILLPFMVLHFWGPPWTALRIAGLGIGTACLLLLALARIQLGRAFSVQAKASTLVTSGLYSRIRNPIYVFGGLAIAGFMLWINLPRLLCFVVVIPMQVWRSRVEERVLTEKFGEKYLEYKRQTWF